MKNNDLVSIRQDLNSFISLMAQYTFLKLMVFKE